MALSIVSSQAYPRPRNRMEWLIRVFGLPTKKMEPYMKMVVFGLSQEYVRQGLKHTEIMTVWFPNIEGHSGVSSDKIGKGIKWLASVGGLVRGEETVRDKVARVTKTHITVVFTPQFMCAPEMLLADAKENNIGGRRTPRHKGCGGEITTVCTACGEINISKKDMYYDPVDIREEGHTPEQEAELQRLDEQIEAVDSFYDLSEIDDATVDGMGGPDVVMNASSLEIAERMAQPVYARYGLDGEDMAAADAALAEMKQKKKPRIGW